MDDILRSHVIQPEFIRADDFESFFEKRAHALLDRIEHATGKPISREQIEKFLTTELDEIEEESEWDESMSEEAVS